MDVEDTAPNSQPLISREKTAPFLIRAFVKIGGFHRLSLFEDGTLPTTDELQIYTWKDATLREVLTSLRNTAPTIPEYRHPLARFSFRAVYADSTNKGRFSPKDLGMVYSRDILGEPGSLGNTAPRLREDREPESREPADSEKVERTLDELRFVPGDYLLVSVLLPKNLTNEMAGKGPGPAAPAPNGWKSGQSGPSAPSGPGAGRGGSGHWRGGSDAPTGPSGRGGRGRGGDDRDRSDRRVPPPRRGADSPPPVRGRGWGARGGRGGRGGGDGGRRSRSRSFSRSPSRSPPRRRRYD